MIDMAFTASGRRALLRGGCRGLDRLEVTPVRLPGPYLRAAARRSRGPSGCIPAARDRVDLDVAALTDHEQFRRFRRPPP